MPLSQTDRRHADNYLINELSHKIHKFYIALHQQDPREASLVLKGQLNTWHC